MLKPLLFALLIPTQAHACPDPDRTAEADRLFGVLENSADEASALLAANDIWRFWFVAPDEAAQELLDGAVERREAHDFLAAEEKLDRLVAYCPNYSEGWNQRAFVRFLRGNYDGSIADLDVTLGFEPRHFGALSGKALNFHQKGSVALGQIFLRRALAIHPWMAERGMLLPQTEEPL